MKNPPAFPTSRGQYYDNVAGKMKDMGDDAGMTLRDYFAAKAMQGLLSNPRLKTTANVIEGAYKTADEMLAEREKPQ